MQKGHVYRNTAFVGEIIKTQEADNDIYVFKYAQGYLDSDDAIPISVNLPLQSESFTSDFLFPFFSNMLSEGSSKTIQCLKLRIDEEDAFTRLLKTVEDDPIGSITIKEVS